MNQHNTRHASHALSDAHAVADAPLLVQRSWVCSGGCNCNGSTTCSPLSERSPTVANVASHTAGAGARTRARRWRAPARGSCQAGVGPPCTCEHAAPDSRAGRRRRRANTQTARPAGSWRVRSRARRTRQRHGARRSAAESWCSVVSACLLPASFLTVPRAGKSCGRKHTDGRCAQRRPGHPQGPGEALRCLLVPDRRR